MKTRIRRRLRSYAATLTLTVVGAAAGSACSQSSEEGTASQSAIGDANSLDTMDVAILLPIPGALSLADGMLSPMLPNASGKPLLTRETFTSILDARTAKDADGHLVKSGINLSGKRSPLKAQGQIRQGPVEFGKYEQWKISSVRLDPCAPTQAVNHATQPNLTVGDQFDPNKCSPHLNVVIQPLVRGSDELARFSVAGSDLLSMGDYAIHLLFALSDAEMRAAAQDFLGLKNACASIAQTYGMPLGVHPCFSKEAELAKVPADFALHRKLAGIVGKYANNLVNAAVMGTDLGQDPWMFYPGHVKSGIFEPVRVFTVTKDPASAPIDSRGNRMRLPFDNARFQMLTLAMTALNDVANPIVPASADARDSIVYSFQAPFSDAIRNPAKDPAAVALVQQKLVNLVTDTHRLEHPMRNDFFSVDCISCHTSTAQEHRLSRASSVVKASRIRFVTQNDSAAFRSPTTTTTVSPEARQQGAGTVVNFAYRYNMPSVSRRVAYEASLSAAMLNRSFLSAPQKNAECAQPELETCLELLASANPLFRSGPSLRISSLNELNDARKDSSQVIAECKKLVCNEKARLTELTANKSTTLASGGLLSILPAGTTMYAYVPPAVSSGVIEVTHAAFRQTTSQLLDRITIDLADFTIER